MGLDIAIYAVGKVRETASWSVELSIYLYLLSAQCVSSIGQIIKSVCVSVSQSVSQ